MLKTRIAPTPSGFLHLGNAFSFLLTWLIARQQKGSIHLRIDDIDSDRVRPEYVQDIFDSLRWLGLDWDSEARSQVAQKPLYASYLARLLETEKGQMGVYACACSRKEIQTQARNGLYGQTCVAKNLPKTVGKDVGESYSLRLHIPDSAEVRLQDALQGTCLLKPAEIAGDLVIWRKNNEPAYQLASLVDDLQAGINFIVRGEDLWSSTAFQVYLAEALGEASFARSTFLHHALVCDSEGNKLSKSAGATSLRALREQASSPTEVYKRFAEHWHLPTSDSPTLQELLEACTSIVNKLDISKKN